VGDKKGQKASTPPPKENSRMDGTPANGGTLRRKPYWDHRYNPGKNPTWKHYSAGIVRYHPNCFQEGGDFYNCWGE